jgi:hypothetical protein
MGWNDDRRMRKNCIAAADGRSGAAVPLRGSDAYHSHALHYFSVAYEATVREEGVQRCMQLRDLHLFFLHVECGRIFQKAQLVVYIRLWLKRPTSLDGSRYTWEVLEVGDVQRRPSHAVL